MPKTNLLKNYFLFTINFLLVTTLFFAVFLGVFYTNISKKPRHYNFIPKVIEFSLGKNYSVTASDSLIFFDKNTNNLQLKFIELKIQSLNNIDNSYSVDNIEMELNWKKLFLFKFDPHKIHINKLVIDTNDDEQEHKITQFNKESFKRLINEINFLSTSDYKYYINHALFNIKNKTSVISINIDNIYISGTNAPLGHDTKIKADISLNHKKGKIEAIFSKVKKELQAKINFVSFPLFHFAYLANHNSYIYSISDFISNIDITGNVKLLIKNNMIYEISTDINSDQLNNPANEKFFINKFSLSSRLNKHGIIDIPKLCIGFNNNALIETSAKIKETDITNLYFDDLHLDTKIINYPVEYLYLIWPDLLEPEVRNYIITSIPQGIITNANGHFHIKENYIKAGIFPLESIDATIEVEDGKYIYDSNFPSIENAKAIVSFDPYGVTITSNKANIANMDVKNLEVKIPYYTADGNFIKVDGKVYGPVKELLKFNTSNKKFSHMNPEILYGQSENNVNISINFDDNPITYESINFDITSSISNFSIEKLIGDIKINNGNLTGKFDGKIIDIKGTVNVHESPSKVNLFIDTADPNNSKNQISLTGKILSPAENIFENISLVEGAIPFEFLVNFSEEQNSFKFFANLTESEIIERSLNYLKMKNSKATILAKGYSENNVYNVSKIEILGDNIDIKGEAKITYENNKIIEEKLNLDKINFGQNEFSANYINKDGIIETNIKGTTIDLSKANFKTLNKKNKTTKYKEKTINLKLNKLFLHNDQELNNISFTSVCAMNACNYIDVVAEINNSAPLKIFFDPKLGKDKIEVIAEDAGSLAKGFGIYRDMAKGKLVMSLTQKTSPFREDSFYLDGKIVINNFIINKTSGLTRLLSLASPGIFDTLKSPGDLTFDKLSSKFEYNNEILKIQKMIFVGDQMGMVLKGDINFPKDNIALNGTIVPSLMGINGIINKIPLIGKAITGGKGEGLFGANFKIHGHIHKPHTSLNPLSLLTPGFLRSIFSE